MPLAWAVATRRQRRAGWATVYEYLARAEAVGVAWPLPEGCGEAASTPSLFPPIELGDDGLDVICRRCGIRSPETMRARYLPAGPSRSGHRWRQTLPTGFIEAVG